MGKGGGGTTTSTSSNTPPPEVMAQYRKVIQQANQTAQTPYTTGGFNAGNMVQGFSPDQQTAFNTVDNAQGIQAPYTAQAQSYLQNSQAPIWNNAQQYNPQTMANYANPYMNTAIAGTEAQMNNMDAQQQQQVIGNAVSHGAWGGDRSAIAQSELANQQGLANGQVIGQMENAGFQQQQQEFNQQQQAQIGANEANAWLGTQGSALENNLGTSALNDTLTGANAQLATGAQQQQLGQSQLNVPYEQFQAQQAYPFQIGNWLSQISTGLGSNSGGTSTTSQQAPSSNSWFNRGGFVPARASGGFVPHLSGGGMGGVPDPSQSYFSNMSGSPAGSSGRNGIPTPPTIQAPKQPDMISQLAGLSGLTKDAFGLAKAGKGMFGSNTGNFSPTDVGKLKDSFGGQGFSPGEFGSSVDTQGSLPWLSSGSDGASAAASSPDMWSTAGDAFMSMFNKGGSVPHRAFGGNLLPDVLSGIGDVVGAFFGDPMAGSQATGMLSKLDGGETKPGLQPSMITNMFARGGSPRHYDDGGSDDITTPDPDGLSAPASSTGFSPVAGAMPSHDAFMKNYSDSVANQKPYNEVDPWLSVATGVAGALAGNSPHISQNIANGALAGLQDYGAQKKEAAAESEKRGTLQEQGENLYNTMLQHKDMMSHQDAQLAQQKVRDAQTAANQSGLLTNDIAKTRIAQQVADQGKVAVDPFGQKYYTSGPKQGQNVPSESASGTSIASGTIVPDMANVWKPPVDKDGNPITGSDYYSYVPPMVAKEGKLMQDGVKASPSSFGSRDPVLRAGEAAASNADPTFVGTRFSTIQDFTKSSTPAAATARSQTAIAEHLPVMQEAISALNNGDERPLNLLANAIAKQNGEAPPTNTEMAMGVVADEGAKAIIGSRATQGDREEFAKNLTTAAGRAQLQGQINTAGKLIAGQMHAGEQAYNTGTGLDPNRTPSDTYNALNYRDKFMSESPNARKLFETYYPSPLPSAANRVVGKTYWGKGGVQRTWTKDENGNMGWAAPQGAQ